MAGGLEQRPCLARCAWADTTRRIDNLPVFACRGCHSEWTPDQGWTPCNADGLVPEPIREAVRRQRGLAR
jgi:hypothetical protein